AGPGCDRPPAAWEAGRPIFPRILRALLLPSVVYLLRGSSAVLAAATVQPGCVGREYHGTGTDRSAASRAMAVCGERSLARCGKQSGNTSAQQSQRGCSPSSSIEPGIAGASHDVW